MWTSLQKLFQKHVSERSVAALHWMSDGCTLIVLSQDKLSLRCTFRRSLMFQNNDWLRPLQKLLAELPPVQQMTVTLAPEFYQLVQLDKPEVPENELKAALRWQLKDLVSFEPGDMQFDYIDLPGAHQQQSRLQVVVSSQRMLRPLVHCLHSARVPVNTILPEEWVLKNLLPAQTQPVLLLSQRVGQDLSIMILRAGRVCFSRRVRGLPSPEQLSLDSLHQGYLDALSLEVQRSVDYFEGQLKQAPVRQLVLALNTALQADIAGFFRQLGFAEVQQLQFSQWLPELDLQQQAQFATSLAAALEYESTAEQEVGYENAS